MCGIGGVSTTRPFSNDEATLCWRLLDSLQRRGEDAWGYFDGFKIYKEPGAFRDSVKYDTLEDDLVKARTNIFLCHTRLTTQGNPEHNPNNHPFELGDFIFAHNGILYYTDPFENVWDIETDSFWMLYWIWKEDQQYGDILEAIRAGVQHVAGNYACWLWDRSEHRIYLWRVANPIMETQMWEGKDMFVFGSDYLSLVDGFGLRKLAKRFKFVVPDIQPLPPLTIFTVDGPFLGKGGRFKPRLLDLADEDDFEERQGYLMRYHRRVVSGRGVRR